MMKKVLRLPLLVLLLLCFKVLLAAESPVDMLETTANNMINALKQNHETIKSNPAYVETLARQILLPQADSTLMAQLALGRDGWNNATASQRQEFTQQFTTLLIRTYASAFAAYTNETVKFYPVRGGIEGKTRIQVTSAILQSGGPSIPVEYRLLLRNNQWKVYDITVDGVSMIQSFRSQFSNQLAQGGMDSLLAAMQQHNLKMTKS